MEIGSKLSADGGTGKEDVQMPISTTTALPSMMHALRMSQMRPSPFNSSVLIYEIQTIGSANKDQPVQKPMEIFEHTYTVPLSVRPVADKTKVVARMSGDYNLVQLAEDRKTQLSSTSLKAELGAFHFIIPE